MNIESKVIALVRRFEPLRLKAERRGGEYVAGYGHVCAEGETIDSNGAVALLESDVRMALRGVEKLLGIFPATDGQKFPIFRTAALVVTFPPTDGQKAAFACLALSIGIGCVKASTALAMHKAGRHEDAARAFLLWAGDDSEMIERRKAEADLYRS